MVNLPFFLGSRLNANANAQSASPYKITTGTDNNLDGVVNDRPGDVGRNSARGSARFDVSMRLSRNFSFGPQRGQGGTRGGNGQTGGGRTAGRAGGRPTARPVAETSRRAASPAARRRSLGRAAGLGGPAAAAPVAAAEPLRECESAVQRRGLDQRQQRVQPRELRELRREPAVDVLRYAPRRPRRRAVSKWA